MKNCLLANDYINNKLPTSFDEYFLTQKQQHSVITRGTSKGHLFIPNVNTVRYGRKSITHQTILSYNFFIDKYPNVDFTNIQLYQLKTLVKKHYLNTYTVPS